MSMPAPAAVGAPAAPVPLVTAVEGARRVGVSDQTVHDWVARKRVTPAGKNSAGRWLFRLEDLQQARRFMGAGTHGGTRPGAGRKPVSPPGPDRAVTRSPGISQEATKAPRHEGTQGHEGTQAKEGTEAPRHEGTKETPAKPPVDPLRAEAEELRARLHRGELSDREIWRLQAIPAEHGGITIDEVTLLKRAIEAQEASVARLERLGTLVHLDRARAEFAPMIGRLRTAFENMAPELARRIDLHLKIDRADEIERLCAAMVAEVIEDVRRTISGEDEKTGLGAVA